ncbi:MAG: PEP-utilizing enzyme [Alphaproteobacteria bacterium]
MQTLWLKFADDSTLPQHFNDEDKKKLQRIYDVQDAGSVWRRAAAALGFPAITDRDLLLRWHNDAPYINWSLMVEMVTSGWVALMPSASGGFEHIVKTNLFGLFRLLKSQWKVGAYLAERLTPDRPLPVSSDEQLVESTALGLALQSIMLRLPAHTPQELATWLAAPDSAPQKVRRTVKEIQAIQKHRTLLSPAWEELFPHHLEPAHLKPAPAYFWDEPPKDVTVAPVQRAPIQNDWTGLPVCAGQVTGKAILVRKVVSSLGALDPSDFPVLVFPRARPETVELFPHASALLFAEGGAMSHACTVAREQGIPCITGLGPDFFQRLEEMGGSLWIAMDGAAGTVKIIQR